MYDKLNVWVYVEDAYELLYTATLNAIRKC